MDAPASSPADDSDNVKVFRISDLIGTLSNESSLLKQASVKRNRRGCAATKAPILTEASAFKVSSKIAVHGNKPKRLKKSANANMDILWHHEQKLTYFAKLQELLPEKRTQLAATASPWKRKLLLREIESIENRDEELRYMLMTHDVIAEYTRLSNSVSDEGMKRDTSGAITKYIGKYDNVEKDRLTEEYCRLVNNGLMMDTNKLYFDSSTCQFCGSDTRINEGFVCCTSCGIVVENSVQDFQFSYKDLCDHTQKSGFSYKRSNRFQEILSTLQAKENIEIPAFVMNAVLREIHKEPDPDLDSVDNAKIRRYLKRLSLTTYYEHIPHILNKVNGIRPVRIPQEVEEKLREMFKMIQEPFETVRAEICPRRISFLSYNFVLFKFCQLLNLSEYQRCFTLLKSPDKLKLQDRIWKGICEILEWEYIPSTG